MKKTLYIIAIIPLVLLSFLLITLEGDNLIWWRYNTVLENIIPLAIFIGVYSATIWGIFFLSSKIRDKQFRFCKKMLLFLPLQALLLGCYFNTPYYIKNYLWMYGIEHEKLGVMILFKANDVFQNVHQLKWPYIYFDQKKEAIIRLSWHKYLWIYSYREGKRHGDDIYFRH